MITVNKLISVIVPVYNKAQYLHRCIQSIIKQTYKNLEIIIVNDGSTDNSIDICNYYANRDQRIMIIDKENKGVSSARNAGLDVARGEYIAFVDADDYIDKNMYYTLLHQIISEGSDICTMVKYSIRKKDTVRGKPPKVISADRAIKKLLLLYYPSSMCVSLFKRDVIVGCRSDIDIHFFEDIEHHFRILLNANMVSLNNQELYYYRTNESSINKTGINSKRITCLGVYSKIVKELINANKLSTIPYAQFFRSHALISMIASIAKTWQPDNSYYIIVKKYAREILGDIIKSSYVPCGYIMAIGCCALAPSIFCSFLKLTKYRGAVPIFETDC